MRRLLPCLAALMIAVPGAFAQNEYTIKIENDKKILYIDRLGLPESATIWDALSVLPEHIGRSTETLLGTYQLKIEDYGLNEFGNEVLAQLKANLVERIEICESTVDNYRNNGQGGSINIFLKPIGEGFSGQASVAAYSTPSVMPSVLLGYKKGNFTLRAVALLDYYAPYTTDKLSQGYYGSKDVPYSIADSTTSEYAEETVRMIMEYRPSDRDEIKLRASQYYNWSETGRKEFSKQGDIFSNTQSNDTKRCFGIDLDLDYVHKFHNRDELELEGSFNRTPNTNSISVLDERNTDSELFTNAVSGSIEYTHFLKTRTEGNFSKLIFGIGTNATESERYDNLHIVSGKDDDYMINSVIHTWFVAPYVKSDSKLGPVRLKAELQYQFYNYDVRDMSNAKFTRRRGDPTGRILAGWQINDNNHLQLVLDHKLERPTGMMLYPYHHYSTENNRNEFGNPDLVPVMINEAGLGYITDFTKGKNDFIFNVEGSFINANNLLSATKVDGDPITYYTFNNSGTNNILSGRLTAIYKYGPLSVSLTGNIFDNHKKNGDSKDHYTYYNISLYPSVKIGKGWDASALLTYHSRLTTSESELGAYTVLTLSVGKSWNKLGIYLIGVMPLGGRSTDISYQNGLDISTSYWYLRPYAGLSVNYKF